MKEIFDTDTWNYTLLSAMDWNTQISKSVVYLRDVTQLLQGLTINSVATNFLTPLNKRQTVSTVQNIPN